MATNIFVYWSDGLGAGYLTVIVSTGGGAFANESCPQDRAFDQFFSMPGICPGEMLAARIDSHIIFRFRSVNPILHGSQGGRRAESAHANFKDSCLRPRILLLRTTTFSWIKGFYEGKIFSVRPQPQPYNDIPVL